MLGGLRKEMGASYESLPENDKLVALFDCLFLCYQVVVV